MNGYLLDTNVPSELTHPRPEPLVERWLDEVDDERLFLSVISLAEICKGIAKLTLVTRNVKDFSAFGISVLNPWIAP